MDRRLKITILYDAIEDRVREEAQVRGEHTPRLVYEELTDILGACGHDVSRIAATTGVELATALQNDRSDLIFNVCESLAGVGKHEVNVAAMLELFGKRFTGAGSIGLALAGDKALAKKLLNFHGISTPRFSVMQSGQLDHVDDLSFPMFVKPSNEDASIGIDHHSIVHNFKELMKRISFIESEFSSPALIEEFIDGREIYAGVLCNGKPEALPLVEWDFSNVPDGAPKIASAEAKWDEDSPRYKNAPEVIVKDLPDAVVKAVQHAALEAFRALKMRDYARVDMRVRQRRAGEPRRSWLPGEAELPVDPQLAALEGWEFYLIEVNPNPHLATNSELPLAAKASGLEYGKLIERLVDTAMARPS